MKIKKKKKKEGNTFGAIKGYDSDAILMNRALHEFFGHSGKCSHRKGRLKKNDNLSRSSAIMIPSSGAPNVAF